MPFVLPAGLATAIAATAATAAVAAEAAFSNGVLAIGPRPVPSELLTALRTAAHDTNPRVAIEALYAFGTLAVEPAGSRRRAASDSGSTSRRW